MPNTFALIALLAWPLIAIGLFRALSVPMAAATSIIAGYLLLPKRGGFDLPLLPPYDDMMAAALPALILAVVMTRQAQNARMTPAAEAPSRILDGWLPRAMVPRICVLLMVATPVVTAILNDRPLAYGPLVLPGLGPYDAASSVLLSAAGLLPFIIGRKYLAHPEEHASLLWLLCLGGLVYSFLALYEVRMSPQLNRMVYGYQPDWFMSIRRGGWRPSVFLGMGLRVGIFFAISVLAAVGLFRLRGGERGWPFIIAAVWLLFCLFMTKTLGAFLIAMALVPVILMFGVRLQLVAAAALAGIVLLYPMMRNADLVPTDWLTNNLMRVASVDRVNSLIFRFDNEDMLLDKAQERPLFGWGPWGRSRVYDETGTDISITDGTWVIVFGVYGWFGYLGQFGLLTAPILFLALRRKRYEATLATSVLCVVLAANLVDLVPNSGLTSVTWLIAGALVGRLEVGTAAAPVPAPTAPQPAGPQGLAYRRHLSDTPPPKRNTPVPRRSSRPAPVRRAPRPGQGLNR